MAHTNANSADGLYKKRPKYVFGSYAEIMGIERARKAAQMSDEEWQETDALIRRVVEIIEEKKRQRHAAGNG